MSECVIAQRNPKTDRPKYIAQQTTIVNGDCLQKGVGAGRSPLVRIGFHVLCRVTMLLPFGALVFCFVTAVMFQFEEVNRTVCNVTNIVPSISAITGITPQRYVWRICIALHSAPRFAIGVMYWYYYLERSCFVRSVSVSCYRHTVDVTFFVYIIENSCLIGLTYIANVENYPVHEKLFIFFMISSLFYELLTILSFRWTHPVMNDKVARSYNMKRLSFVLILLFTVGMLYFFYNHRFYCLPGAFTKFACCEYVIVLLNITFHYSAIRDFGEHEWQFIDRSSSSSSQYKKMDGNDNHKAAQ